MSSNIYPNGINNLILRNLPITVANPGKIWFVGNSTAIMAGQVGGSDGNDGSFNKSFATTQKGLDSATANRGDIVIVKAGHTEAISSATILAFNKAGVAIVGLGSGSNRPTYTFTTAATANIPLTVANGSISNLLFIANFADITSAITATGTALTTDFVIDNCEFRDTSSVLNFVKTFTGNATANSADGFTYTNNKVFGLSTTAASQAVIIAAATNRCTYADNFVVYPVLNDTAALVDFGANAQLNLTVARNRVFRPSTSTTGGSLFSGGSTTSTGYVYDNYSWHLDNSAGLLAPTGTKLGFQNNFCMITAVADKSGLINPVAV